MILVLGKKKLFQSIWKECASTIPKTVWNDHAIKHHAALNWNRNGTNPVKAVTRRDERCWDVEMEKSTPRSDQLNSDW